ncbi:MAG: cytidylate kinase family protein [Nitrospirae bacterium]|nr:cytidylate kinase family protein [Nitrospirota bacterium]
MAVITISKASMGKTVADGVRREFCYGYFDSDEVFLAASKDFGVPEAKIRSALEVAPKFWGMSSATRQKLIACYQSTLAKFLLRGNVVYYGPAGHLLIQGVSHALKVFLWPGDNTTGKSVGYMSLHEVINGESLCDLVIDTGKTSVEDAVKIISDHALSTRYHTTTYSMNCVKNIALSSKVKAALIDVDHDVNVRASGGSVYIHVRAADRKRQKLTAAIGNMVKSIRDVVNVEVTVTEDIFQKYAGTYR